MRNLVKVNSPVASASLVWSLAVGESPSDQAMRDGRG